MPLVAVLWNGSPDEATRFVAAIARHCECEQLKRRCPAHELMLDQHLLDHLLFLRWLRLKEAPCK